MPLQSLRTRQAINSNKKDDPQNLKKGDDFLPSACTNDITIPLRTIRRGPQEPKRAQRQTSFKHFLQYILYFAFIVAVWIPVALVIVPAARANGGWLVDAVTSTCAHGYSFLWINFQVFTGQKLSLIETRLARVEDCLGGPLRRRRDFALRGAGARILDQLTSPTHGYRSPGSRSWFEHPASIHDYEVNLPVILLEDQVLVGECWEFLGSIGHVGILLPEAVQIDGLTITHVDPALLSKEHVERAPKNITLWGLVDLLSDSLSGIDPTTLRATSSFAVGKSKSPTFPDTHQFLPLLNVHFDIKSLSCSTRRFKITNPLAERWVNAVIIEVNENWGGATTCMYHVGIHGAADAEWSP